MQVSTASPFTDSGLRQADIPALQKRYGRNVFQFEYARRPIHIFLDTVKEPMLILLVIACVLYFILGQTDEGILMLVAMSIVVSISIYQEMKSSRALSALQELTLQQVTVLRDGVKAIVPSAALVPGDVMLLEEGMQVPADAMVLQQNDLSVNESVITGESMPVYKQQEEDSGKLYQGSTINSGSCMARVTATGNRTVLGKLGKSIDTYRVPKTALQHQVNRFVRRLALFGIAGFVVIFAVNYFHYQQVATSLLFALTLAMSAVPEEIPVAFSSFMALGAHKMSKLGIISRQPQVVENLGAVSVMCLDKTGTITENKMSVREVAEASPGADTLLFAVLASEQQPFDSMEKAIWETYLAQGGKAHLGFGGMVHEYPLQGRPPMMTHVYEKDGVRVAAGKGAIERIAAVCGLRDEALAALLQQAGQLASNGYRVIGVAAAIHTGISMPDSQDDFNWSYKGLLALYDPPRTGIGQVIQQFYAARIQVKLLTGDFPATALNIAAQVGIRHGGAYLTGDQVMQMDDAALRRALQQNNILVRMFPDAKFRVIESLKASGEIVAMTGDGVNDGPALKAADVGIAMGLKGTQIARQAADLVLTDDDLHRMVAAISEGRKIYGNLKKAIRYIISIHIPIILIASLPVVLGWRYPNIFTPVHVIFLELIMGPTCSIFFEREPAERNSMRQRPRRRGISLFAKGELLIAIIQGLVIAAGALALYYYFMSAGQSLACTRTIVFTNLVVANVFLTFADRSFTHTIYHTSTYRNNLAVAIPAASVLFLAALHLAPPVRDFFQLAPIARAHFLVSVATAMASVMWFEVYKALFVQRRALQ